MGMEEMLILQMSLNYRQNDAKRIGERKMLRPVGRYVIVFLAVMVCLMIMLTMVFMIPDDLIKTHQETSLYIVDEMENNIWFGNFFGRKESRLDQQTDRIMIRNVMPEIKEMSAFQKALYMNGYGRYWHGYVLYLRFLMVFFDLWEIRYINMIVFFVLFAADIGLISKKIHGKKGFFTALLFSLSIVLCYIVIITSCLQYYSSFLVMLIVSAIVLIMNDNNKYSMLFMITGIVTNFVDFLTVPLITLGMPLLILIVKENDSLRENSYGRQLLFLMRQCLAWGAGYGVCWISKWILSMWMLPQEYIDASVSQHALFWLSDAGAGTRLWAFRMNIPYYFAGHGMKIMLLSLAIPIALGIIGSIYHKKYNKIASLYLIVAFMPYLWYFVFNGHSFYHAWFTFRLQAVTLFGIGLFLLERIDFDRLDSIGKHQ